MTLLRRLLVALAPILFAGAAGVRAVAPFVCGATVRAATASRPARHTMTCKVVIVWYD